MKQACTCVENHAPKNKVTGGICCRLLSWENEILRNNTKLARKIILELKPICRFKGKR